ncbi:MAG: exonuclease SbcCD subunit D, partial [Candidatus Brockarchaeota archaeon]|nr:exonuclease SbcCD subunit D [Candidatus Brockarchaeota archaeon]
MTIKIIHTADNHLDPSFQKFKGKTNERRRDFRINFEKIIKFCLENKVDVLLLSGDIFDRINPRNPPRSSLMKWFRDLTSNGTKIFMIGGNHDMPRSVEEAESPLLLFEKSGYARFFGSTEEVETENLKIGDLSLTISGLSFNHNFGASDDPLSNVKIPEEGDFNILMLHYSITGVKQKYPYALEPIVKASKIPKYVNYVAAGHLHKPEIKVLGNTTIIYPGSTEKLTFDEAEDKKGFYLIELEDNLVQKQTFINLETRPMQRVSLEINSSNEKNIQSYIQNEILKLKDENLILRVDLKGRVDFQTFQYYNKVELLRNLEKYFFLLEINDADLVLKEEGNEVSNIDK